MDSTINADAAVGSQETADRIVELLEQADDRFGRFRHAQHETQNSYHDDAVEHILEAMYMHTAAQTLMIAEIGKVLAMTLGSGKDLGILLDRIHYDTRRFTRG